MLCRWEFLLCRWEPGRSSEPTSLVIANSAEEVNTLL